MHLRTHYTFPGEVWLITMEFCHSQHLALTCHCNMHFYNALLHLYLAT
uniref:Uncharacterized protein n=1 Tax=Anguilla anguilla TaxID=7936 RepID=A0A0E9R8B1_ANGAN